MKGLIIGLLILSMLAVGCWDIRDIDNKVYVSAIGLDFPQDSTKNYKVTLEFWTQLN